jgi:hypothetical protein
MKRKSKPKEKHEVLVTVRSTGISLTFDRSKARSKVKVGPFDRFT